MDAAQRVGSIRPLAIDKSGSDGKREREGTNQYHLDAGSLTASSLGGLAADESWVSGARKGRRAAGSRSYEPAARHIVSVTAVTATLSGEQEGTGQQHDAAGHRLRSGEMGCGEKEQTSSMTLLVIGGSDSDGDEKERTQ